MPKSNPAFDAYIAKSPAYARPILTKIRSLFHKACAQIEEVMKWSFPHFEYRGAVAGMAAFKEHCRFGFWKASLMSDPAKMLGPGMEGTKIASLADLPSDKIMLQYIREAVDLNQRGVKIPKVKKPPKKPVEIPDYFLAALKKNKKALATFEAFSPSHKREYVEWITDAKQEKTREQRIATAIEWMAEGKVRHWKYQR